MNVPLLPRAAAERSTGRRLPPEQREAALLAMARVVLSEVGYENFLPAEVARRCGVTKGLVYRYFPTKRDLLSRVAEEWLAEILAHEPDLSGCADTYERLREVIAYSLGVVSAEPTLTRYILLELRAEPDFRDSVVYQLNRRFTGIVMRVLRQAVAQGEFRRDISLIRMRDMIFGAIEHQTWAYLRGEGEFPVQQSAAEIAAVICGGMRVPPLVEARQAAPATVKRPRGRRPSRSD
jgi:AcrR family transcriptional regulator